MPRNCPDNSPWGRIDHFTKICDGVYSVSTASHGGIMAATSKAPHIFSAEALQHGFTESGYVCFEEDCAATVALRELIDRHLYKPPVNEYWKPGEYVAVIDASVKRWYPNYWAARESGATRTPAAPKRSKKERER